MALLKAKYVVFIIVVMEICFHLLLLLYCVIINNAHYILSVFLPPENYFRSIYICMSVCIIMFSTDEL